MLMTNEKTNEYNHLIEIFYSFQEINKEPKHDINGTKVESLSF
jgi:hypothetical protein